MKKDKKKKRVGGFGGYLRRVLRANRLIVPLLAWFAVFSVLMAAACRTEPPPDETPPKLWDFPPEPIGYDGHVYDADTGEPIKGAQIWAEWWYVTQFFGQTGSKTQKKATAETDINGYYQMPVVRWRKGLDNDMRLDFIIYKKGYIAYSEDGGFKGTYSDHEFKNRDNKVYLKKWDLGDDRFLHREHIHFMIIAYGCRDVYDKPDDYKETKKFCMEVYDELIKSLD